MKEKKSARGEMSKATKLAEITWAERTDKETWVVIVFGVMVLIITLALVYLGY